jgi:hypothetical protein
LFGGADAPLYSGQQRGTLVLTIYDARHDQKLVRGDATVVFPHDLNNQKQLEHLKQTLQRLVEKIFR